MKHFFPCLILFLLAIPTTVHSAEVIRIGVEDHYPPFSYTGKAGLTEGFNVDVSHALCRIMHRSCVVTPYKWDRLIPALLEGKIDAIVANMADSEERRERMDFTHPYQISRCGFVASREFRGATSLDMISDRTICTQSNTTLMEYLQDKFSKNNTIRGTETTNQALENLNSGQCELVLTPLFNAYEFLNSPAGKNCDLVGNALSEEEYPHSGSCIAIRRGEEMLLRDLNAAIATLLKSEEYTRISRNYLPFTAY